ncbi:MAG TPA: M1 family metallopeptidase [Nocardioides sp.]|uniref:M1 family metallopeptidase n=1 Tax=Nocardioides sp. TaxID=35761 RepID=UPI002F4201C8
MPQRGRGLAAALALLGIVAAGCGSGSTDAPPAPHVGGASGDTGTTAYDAGISEPREDSVYPDVGDPGVDALHYDLDLSWDPKTERLTATESVLLRAARTADHLQLDLARQLVVGHVWLDGKVVPFQHPSKDLVVAASVTKGSRHLLQLTYSGTPEPVTAPTDRSDFDTTGWTIADDGTVWTMQEPYGAYSWYAVNDHPSDKAFYDITIHAPAGQVGVSNGELRSRRTVAGRTVTRWRLPEPAASYLVTIAIGHFTETEDTGPHGLPMSYWTPTGRPGILRRVRYAPQAVAYLESLVGRYPFPSLGILVVPANSAMETQSMVTLGDNRYTLSRDVIVHEIAHQWYGDTVTPSDWSDLWMSEGMATYLAEGNWTADHGPGTLAGVLRQFQGLAKGSREVYGPPAHYRPGSFGEGNAYYPAALMWDTVRQRLGDQEFWSLARRWLTSHRFTSQDRDTLAAWWSKQSGQDLRPLFHAWLLGRQEPAWSSGSRD